MFHRMFDMGAMKALAVGDSFHMHFFVHMDEISPPAAYSLHYHHHDWQLPMLLHSLPLCAGLAVKDGLGMMGGLKAITINAAEICNVSSRVGSLEPGKDADIAIYTGNPLEIFSECLYTIIDGQIVYKK